MSLAAILMLTLWWPGAAATPLPSPSPSPSPTLDEKDDGDAATIFTEDGTEIAWDRTPDKSGSFKVRKAGIPLTVILRADGRIALVGAGYRGERHEKWIADALDTLLKPDATPTFLIHRPVR